MTVASSSLIDGMESSTIRCAIRNDRPAEGLEKTPTPFDLPSIQKMHPVFQLLIVVLHMPLKHSTINSAAVDKLKALHGAGNTYSKKIIDGRPYKRKDELVQKKVVPQATYDKIKDQIVMKHK
jgi:hypothetical protein